MPPSAGNKNWKRTQLPNVNKDRNFGEDRDKNTKRERIK